MSARLQDASPGTALLYGVTGSGKTVAYLRLIDDCLAAGRGAIVLVPEIALTPQLLRQFSVRYGARVAVLHSALRISERYETWKRIRSGDADVVLGTRSAVFAPVRDLGLLIVDEGRSTPTNPKMHRATMPARSRSTAARRSMR